MRDASEPNPTSSPYYEVRTSAREEEASAYINAEKVVSAEGGFNEDRLVTLIAEAYRACASKLRNPHMGSVDIKLGPSDVGLLFRLSTSGLHIAQYAISESARNNGGYHDKNEFDDRFSSDFVQKVANSLSARVVGIWMIHSQ